MPLRIETTQVEPDVVVLEISGKLVFEESGLERIKTIVEDLIQQQKTKVIFDLTSVTYVGDTGIGMIGLCAVLLIRSGGALRVVGSSNVQELIRMTRLDAIVELHPTVAEASRAFTLPSGQGCDEPA